MVKENKLIDCMLVKPGSKISLFKDFDPGEKFDKLTKDQMKVQLEKGIKKLAELQDKLYAQDIYALLIIFQALDAAGKDSTIKHVMSGLNPQGCQVYSFKRPSIEEGNHDYLWRYFRALPEKGKIGIFNRSYYEDVLVTRVHPDLVEQMKLPSALKDKHIWKRRFEEINNFEKYLTQNGVVVLKFFLNISKEEQKKRFLERIDLKEKNWKFTANDVAERQCWDKYMEAYSDCFTNTSTTWAPWYVVPADYKPLTRLAVAHAIHSKMEELNLCYPAVDDEQKKLLRTSYKLLTREN